MNSKSRRWLEDILFSADFIAKVTSAKTLAQYESDIILKSAIERHFEIIGEAMVRIARHDAAIIGRISDARKIIDFRNALIHGYDSIEDAAVWNIIQYKVPELIIEINALLDKES